MKLKRFDWKEFLRPTKGKIIVLGLLILISLVSFYVYDTSQILCSPSIYGGCPPRYGFLFSIFLISFWPSLIFLRPMNLINLFATLLFSIVWIYFLSCLIVFAYNKTKKVNLNNS